MRPTSELYTYIDLGHLLPASVVDSTCDAVRQVLVRHNTDLKQVYRYYAALGCPAEDAFVLTLAQLRTLAVDANLASRELPLATLDQLVMRSITPPPAQQLPRPSILAAAVAGSSAPKDLLSGASVSAELKAAQAYTRRGMHDGERTILLREFVQVCL